MKRAIAILFWLPGAVTRRWSALVQTTLARMTYARIGAGTSVRWSVTCTHPGRVTIGARCTLWGGVELSSELQDRALEIGDDVQINRDVHLDHTGGLILEDSVLISEGAILYTHDHGRDPRSPARAVPKVVETGVWIGARALILPGCQRIGRGAVIGAGAVVTRDVPAGTVVVGNPARQIAGRPVASAAR